MADYVGIRTRRFGAGAARSRLYLRYFDYFIGSLRSEIGPALSRAFLLFLLDGASRLDYHAPCTPRLFAL